MTRTASDRSNVPVPGASGMARVLAARLAMFALAFVLAFSGLARIGFAAKALEAEQNTQAIQIYEIRHGARAAEECAAESLSRAAEVSPLDERVFAPRAPEFIPYRSAASFAARAPPRARAPPIHAA